MAFENVTSPVHVRVDVDADPVGQRSGRRGGSAEEVRVTANHDLIMNQIILVLCDFPQYPPESNARVLARDKGY